MFKSKIVLSNTDVRSLLRAVPNGWVVESTGLSNLYSIKAEGTFIDVGYLKVELGKAVILVDESEEEGKKFWRAFARKYPEQNPFDLRYALLYQVGGKGELFEIDKYPSHSKGDPFSQAIHYKNVTAFVVSFLFGDWVPGESVKVIGYQKIDENGNLESEQPGKIFKLAGIENEDTM